MKIGDIGGNLNLSAATSQLSTVRRLIGLPDMPAIATAATIAAKLQGLSKIDAGGGVTGERLSMLSLGLFLFGIDTIAYQEFIRRNDWRHAANERLGAREAFQFLGPGAETITLPGVLMPELTGPNTSLAQIRAMAETGDAYPMVQSDGTIVGNYIIQAVDERRSTFLPGGGARRVEFAIDLRRAGD
ncbi:phage tail protein [uncultured Sphingopyxis sp.]|jgi:phage protein U|uniref:phage tail protein n=1 Tax=uncultured Sphingopyxis sp. TaxID=310581 RepID=UPI000A59F372|nr:phage tail protein [uncultured Sphingopyxis sp.]